MQVLVIDHSSPHLPTVKALGRKSASTLGFLPEGAFDDHARKRQILVAVGEDGMCIGYVLYRVANRTAKIVHLCTDASQRSSGIARVLIDSLKDETKDLIGISLRCRKDYLANRIWPKFGFVNYGERPGRGKDGALLVTWRLDNGHPTLFDLYDQTEQSDKLDVVVDANVFFDFFDEARPSHAESSVLRADWLDELIQIWVVDEILNDIGRSDDTDLQRRSRERASTYMRPGCKPEDVQKSFIELQKQFLIYKKSLSDQDESDLRHIAKTICSKASFFITRDEILIETLSESLLEKFGVQLMRPSDFVKQIDEIRRERDYQPANLCGTNVQRIYVKAGQDAELIDLFHHGELRPLFQNRFRGFISNVDQFESHVIRDAVGNPVGLVVFDLKDPSRLRIPVLRAKRGGLERTVLRNMIALSVNDSIAKCRQAVEISDTFIASETENALLEEGFLNNGDSWVKFQFNLVASGIEFADHLATFKTKSEYESVFLKQTRDILARGVLEIPKEFYGEIERLFFPLKLSDSPMGSFIVPIKPGWAKELFDSDLAGRGLFPAKEDIALRREQVYYRSRLNSGAISAPARILWYVSNDQKRLPETGAIRAVSQVFEVAVDSPKELFRRFKRLGIYEWKDVFETAKKNINHDLMAIRFGNTELFSAPISFSCAGDILRKFSKGLQVASPFAIPQDAFIEMYQKGTRKK